MKRFLIGFSILGMFIAPVMAERLIEINKLDDMRGILIFGGTVNRGNGEEFTPFTFIAGANASSVEGFTVSASSETTIGAIRDTEYTPQESFNLLPAVLKPMFKQIYQDVIDVDLSQ